MSEKLPPDMRMKLINFICVFAWADFDIQPEEKRFILDLCSKFQVSDEDRAKVESWLEAPPDVNEVADPTSIPLGYREIFLEEILKLIAADHKIDKEEADILRTFRDILFPPSR